MVTARGWIVLGVLLASSALAGMRTTPPSPLASAVLEVLPERDCYPPGEEVRYALRNAGPGTITWMMQPPPVTITDARGVVSMPSQVYLMIIVTIDPGETYPGGWNQTYYLYDSQFRVLPPSYGPVPEGEYRISVTADDPPGIFASAGIRIDWSCASGGLSAEAGPDLEAREGEAVALEGSGHLGRQLGDWETRANVTAPRFGFAHAALGDRVYAAGGYGFYWPTQIPPPTVTEAYDPATDAWTVVAEGPGCGGKPGIAGAALDGRFYAFGAYVGPCDVVVNSTEVLDEALGRWTPRADMPTPRVDLAVAVVGGKAYAIGGRTPGGNDSAANEAYDPATDSWEVRAPMPTPRSFLGAAVVDGRILAIGGSAGNAAEVYDPATDTWVRLPSIPGYPLAPSTAVRAGQVFLVHVVGGFDTTVRDLVLIYDPATRKAISGPTMNVPRFGAGLEVVGDALIAVGGGNLCFAGNACPVWETEVLPLTDPSVAFAWDANDLVDSDGDGNFTDDVDATGPTLAWVYGDDGLYTATLTATDASNRSARDTARITVANVAPRPVGIDWSVQGGVADLGLRVAGRKWNVVNLTLLRDGAAVATASVRRVPGSPDDQIAWISGPFEADAPHEAVVTYEPADLGGREVGANPVWLVARDSGGNTTVLAHHTFNVQQSVRRGGGTGNHVDLWRVDLSGQLGPAQATVRVAAEDDGSDDLTFAWSWGDGTPDLSTTYYNDGVGPDPYPSPEVHPITANDARTHPYAAAGTYTVTLTVTDDDGGEVRITFTLAVSP